MGTGKTSTAKALAGILKRRLVDIDALIEKKMRCSIARIFQTKGEAYFRALETAMIRKLCRGKNLVIAAGGGAVLRAENIRNFKKSGLVVALWARPETILKRVGNARSRPLLRSENPKPSIEKLLSERKRYYKKADISVKTDGKTPREVAKMILRMLPQ